MNPLSNTIHLPIKRKWFDMILSGEKKEEYRSISPHYVSRFCPKLERDFFKEHDSVPFQIGGLTNEIRLKEGKDTVTFTNGYSSHSPQIVVELLRLEAKRPNPDWCPPGTEGYWFALVLGKVLRTHNLPVKTNTRRILDF